jgi:hypothetical protein
MEGIMSKRKSKSYRHSPTIAALEAAGIEPTLDEWLAFNEATDTFDAELLDILPVEFRSEYEDRLQLNAEYEAKFTCRREDLVPVGMA